MGESIEELRRLREWARADGMAARARRDGWEECVTEVLRLAGEAFIDGADERATHLRALAHGLRKTGAALNEPRCKEALHKSADAETAHVAALEAAEAAEVSDG